MEVLVYTFRKKDSGVIVCLDANRYNICFRNLCMMGNPAWKVTQLLE